MCQAVCCPQSPIRVFRCSRLWRAAISADRSCNFASSSKRPFPRQVEVRDVPRRMEALRHLERDRERLDNRLQQLEHLLVGLVAIKRRLDRGGEVEHGTCHLQFGLFKPGRGHTLPQRQVENVQKIQRRVQLQFQPGRR